MYVIAVKRVKVLLATAMIGLDFRSTAYRASSNRRERSVAAS